MDIQTCSLLAKYNQGSNVRMDLLINKLDDSQWNKEFGGYFKSIKEVCNHLYIADFFWLKRFSKLRRFNYIKAPLFDQVLKFGTNPIETLSDYLQKRIELDKVVIQFTYELVQDDLEMALSYSDSKGIQHTRDAGGCILHMFNHQTHHRGMISVYLDSLQIDNDYSNLLALV
ncbi:MAG: DinB family protein [Legionella sp.]|uniref:DinB family protein n=1 Tax=Legionella sp. TaxID=459 RepID=UPI0028418B47|nr:DinB family protein [Legionella sp.]